MKFTHREKMMVLLAGLVLLFFVYWTLLLDPVLKKIESERAKTADFDKRIAQFSAMPEEKKKDILGGGGDLDVFEKEEQLSLLLGFIEKQLEKNGIDLGNLRQTASGLKLNISFSFRTSYPKLAAFFGSLKDIGTAYAVENLSAIRDGKDIAVEVQISTPYKP